MYECMNCNTNNLILILTLTLTQTLNLKLTLTLYLILTPPTNPLMVLPQFANLLPKGRIMYGVAGSVRVRDYPTLAPGGG